MQQRKRQRLEKRREALAGKLAGLGHLIRGSLVRSGKTCGNKGCRCHQGERHPYTVISTHRAGRSRLVYVRQGTEDRALAAVEAYRQAWRIVEELSRINMELLLDDARQEKGNAE